MTGHPLHRQTVPGGPKKKERQTWRHCGEARSLARNCSNPSVDELPEIPRENLVNLEIDSTRQLSVVREREIACNLAFLSATSDDSLKVMAVCVEEHCNGRGITIRVAANTGDLSAVTTGFVRLARALEHAALRGWVINLLLTLC
jgi:hypothetical protein